MISRIIACALMFLLFFHGSAHAQTQGQLGGSLVVTTPATYAGTGIGPMVNFEFSITPVVAWTLAGGYLRMSDVEVSSTTMSNSGYPIQTGIKLSIGDKFGGASMYLGTEAGIMFWHHGVSYAELYYPPPYRSLAGQTYWSDFSTGSVAPLIGGQFALTNGVYLDVSARYRVTVWGSDVGSLGRYNSAQFQFSLLGRLWGPG